MPQLRKNDLPNIDYVSMVDFCKKFDRYDNFEDKRRFATQYILMYGMNDKPADYSLAEVIHIARAKLCDASADFKTRLNNDTSVTNRKELYGVNHLETVNPYAKSREEDVANEFFMGKPIEYLGAYAKKNASEIKVENENSMLDTYLRDQYLSISNKINEPLKKDLNSIEKKPNAFDVKFRMEQKLGSKEALEKIVKATKPGFLSRMFNTSSLASKNLDTAYKAFNDPSNAFYGNLNTIEKAANEYLQYKFPGWKPGQPLPTAGDMASLDATSKAKATLSVCLIESAQAQRKIENLFPTLTQEASKKDYDEKEIFDIEEKTELADMAQKEKEFFLKDIAEADAENALIDDGKDFLNDNSLEEEGIEVSSDDDSEIYAVDDENPLEEEFVNAANELGESFLDSHNIAKAAEEEARLKAYAEQQHFQEQFKSDLSMDENVKVDLGKQEQEYLKEQQYLRGEDYQIDFEEFYK